MKICNLCNQNEATQENSHIYPKFMGKSMLVTKDNKRKGYIITNDKINKRPLQDTPKENFILCPKCEKFIADEFEKPFADIIYHKINNKRSYFDVFYMSKMNNYRVYFHMQYLLFKTFVYSMIFRASISNHYIFKEFNLRKGRQEELRKIIRGEIEFKDYDVYALWAKDNLTPSKNLISIFEIEPDVYLLVDNEYLFIIDFTNNSEMMKQLEYLAIKKKDNVRIGIISNKLWNFFISQYYNWNISGK